MKKESPQNRTLSAVAWITLIALLFLPMRPASRANGGGLSPAPADGINTCLKDDSTGNLLQWDSTTGAYTFTRCSDGFTLTGTGVAKLVNGIQTLTDFKTDRRLSAGFNTGQLTGNATIYLKVAAGVWQTFRIVDTKPSAVCTCP